MSYQRVIPRDLFNEASLLKCLGKLWIRTEGRETVAWRQTGDAFDIQQDDGDGSIGVANLIVSIKGTPYRLYRPLNSRAPWPLWVTNPADPNFEDFEVLEAADEGDDAYLSEEMLHLIGVYDDDA